MRLHDNMLAHLNLWGLWRKFGTDDLLEGFAKTSHQTSDRETFTVPRVTDFTLAFKTRHKLIYDVQQQVNPKAATGFLLEDAASSG